MTIDIFIRTYHKDLEFLSYCLRSIEKFVKGHRQVIVCIPEQDAHLLESWNLTKEKVIKWTPATKNGYIDQQISKLKAHEMTDADYILYVDSDVCFFENTDLSEYFVNGKPYFMKTKYELVGEAICWKECTERIIGVPLEYEYMRRIPALYKRSSLVRLDTYIDIDALARLDRLSEFNLIGASIDIFEQNEYHIIDTEHDPLPKTCAKQYWSWGGCTGDVKAELETFLNKP